MPAPTEPLISEEQEKALHRGLVDGEPTAPADLARLFLEHLIGWLVEKNSSRVPQELCVEAAEDALIVLIKSPSSFDPARGKRLAAYLRMSAEGDLRNALKRVGRHYQKEIPVEDVELSLDARKYLRVHDDQMEDLEHQQRIGETRDSIFATVRQGLSDGEARVLDLMLQGERKTAVFAEAMHLTHLPVKAQRLQVKQVKDKVKKRIEREARGYGKPA